LSQQLVVMGIRSLATNLDPTSNIVKAALIDMYVEIGDHISLQYGGSEAHKKVQSSGAAVAIQVPTTGKVSNTDDIVLHTSQFVKINEDVYYLNSIKSY